MKKILLFALSLSTASMAFAQEAPLTQADLLKSQFNSDQFAAMPCTTSRLQNGTNYTLSRLIPSTTGISALTGMSTFFINIIYFSDENTVGRIVKACLGSFVVSAIGFITNDTFNRRKRMQARKVFLFNVFKQLKKVSEEELDASFSPEVASTLKMSKEMDFSNFVVSVKTIKDSLDKAQNEAIKTA